MTSLLSAMMKLSTYAPIQKEIKESLHLTIPLASAQVAQATTGFIDTVIMGWLQQETLAAGGLAATTFTTLLVAATGIVEGASSLIAEAYGKGDKKRIRQITQQGLWLSLLVALPVMLLLGNMDFFLRQFGQSEEIVNLAKIYFDIIIWGFFPALAFALLKNVVSSLDRPRSMMIIVVCSTFSNAIGNYLFGFGKLGFPALGLAGIALSSTISLWGMLLCLVALIYKDKQLQKYQLFRGFFGFEPKIIRELLSIGLPISISFALEVGLFTVATYLMGRLGTEVLAAHQIVFQLTEVIFMVPMGMSFAATVRVAQCYGKADIEGVRRAAYVNICLGATFMTATTIFLLIFRLPVISLFLDVDRPENRSAIALVTSMLIVGALSQILDGVQTTAAGALRGLKDTRVPMLLSLLTFWGIGLSSGYVLGFCYGFGGVGLWLGQSIGVATSAGVFIWRFQLKISRSAKRFL
jgi:MATE family multidrug resistance protein